MTCDMWHVTCNIRREVNILSKFQVPSSYLWRPLEGKTHLDYENCSFDFYYWQFTRFSRFKKPTTDYCCDLKLYLTSNFDCFFSGAFLCGLSTPGGSSKTIHCTLHKLHTAHYKFHTKIKDVPSRWIPCGKMIIAIILKCLNILFSFSLKYTIGLLQCILELAY